MNADFHPERPKADPKVVRPISAERRASNGPDVIGAPVVGICSSAGGLDALTRFFEAMPPKSGMAFVVVPHLDPTHESLMVELLAKHTLMSVSQAEEGLALEPDHVYVIPPNRELSIRGGVLRLSVPTAARGTTTAIDAFLRSLASDQGERAIAIVLSGTGSHGALGIKDVKLVGGMVIAQDPLSAEFDSMPRSAIATGVVDFVLAPDDMPTALISYVRHPYLDRALEAEDSNKEGERLENILALLRRRTKFDFRHYRKNMLVRRVFRRMGLCQLDELQDYEKRLNDDPAELTALCKDFLIGVTTFFRNAEAFQVLEQQVIPKLLERTAEETAVRVWVPACATGEEAYSIGMLFLQAFEQAKRPPRLQIFATDVDEPSLDVARHGIYPDSIAADVKELRLRTFFTRTGKHEYQVNKPLRDVIIFARQNVIGDAPLSRIDLISCRNFLIYLEPQTQEKVIRLFHFSLNDRGYLLLGPSESIGRQTSLFETLTEKWRVYERLESSHRHLVEIPISGAGQSPLAPIPELAGANKRSKFGGQHFSDLTQRMLMADYTPASVLVDRHHEILYFHGATVDFLELPSGQPSTDLLEMSRPGLRSRIRSAILSARESGKTIVDDQARVKRDGLYVACRVTVRPVRAPAGNESLFLVSFEDLPESQDAARAPGSAPSAGTAPTDEARMVEQLEHELKTTREELQGTIEELENSIEELRASNEEILSMNEELQSANEELETSKEELQSMNEEMNTVTAELQGKLRDLQDANNDIKNLLAATDIAALFLDSRMRIKLFTPPVKKLLSVIDSDIGRHISDFSTRLNDDSLVTDALRVLDHLIPIEKEVGVEPGGRCYLRRILPYKTVENRIEGVVVTFMDITKGKRNEGRLEARVAEQTAQVDAGQRHIRSIVDTTDEGIVTIDERGSICMFNPAAERMFGYRAEEVLGRNVAMLMPSPQAAQLEEHLAAYLRTGRARIIGVGREVEGKRKDGTTFPIALTVSVLRGSDTLRFMGTLRDLTSERSSRAELQREKELGRAIASMARVFILRLDGTGRILSFNRFLETLTGYTLEEVRGKDWFATFVAEDEQASAREAFAKAMGGERVQGDLTHIRTKGGAPLLVEWWESLLRLPDEPDSMFAVGHDITARDKLERESIQSHKMEAVGRLASGVAHDFNNLLTGIIGGLRIASGELPPEHSARQLLEEVRGEAERGCSIAHRLLDFSRTGKGSAELFEPRQALIEAERMIRRFIGEDIAVSVVSDDSLSRIQCNVGQFEQSILNLAINSRDAMPHGGRLVIRCKDVTFSLDESKRLGAALEPADYVVVSVEDNGRGMDESTKHNALEPFFTTKDPGLGTGLGLSSVAAMMEKCRGHVRLESELGRGTTVGLYFPRFAGAPQVKPATALAERNGDYEGKTILVVEDEDLVRKGVQHVLEEMGYVVLSAKVPQAALGLLEKRNGGIDVLLSDVVLPGMSGPELAAAVRARYPRTRTLLMSALPAAQLVAAGRLPPGTPMLEKPFSDEELSRKLREALDAPDPHGKSAV